VDDTPGADYQWRLPADWLGSSTTSRLDYIPDKESGTIRVSVRNACGAGDTLSIPITVKNVPGQEQIFTSRDKPCAMSEQEFYVDPKPDHSYHWEVGDGWSVIGDPDGDTVLVSVGMESNFVFVDVTNKCGSRKSNKLFITAPMPDNPLVQVQQSDIPGYKLLSISNASRFTGYEWYRNDSVINSPYAWLPEYIAYLPGTYTVSVTNREGCVNRQKPEDGIRISQQNQEYTAYQGMDGKIVILNSTNSPATANFYNFSGQLVKIATIVPGYNEVDSGWKGACVMTITGPENRHAVRLFTY